MIEETYAFGYIVSIPNIGHYFWPIEVSTLFHKSSYKQVVHMINFSIKSIK